jgi:hypothetical protein
MVTNNSFKVKNGLVVSSTATILSTASSISTDTGAVIVAGGVGIGGDLYVGGRIVASELTVQYTTVTTTIVETDDIITTFNTTTSTSTDTGALVIAGGAGFGGDVNIGGKITAAGTGTIGGLTFGQDGAFPPVLDEFGTTILYDGITTSTIRFADGTVQGSRAPVAWTNSKFISVATYYNIDPGIVFSPVIAGGYVYPGDTYFDDGSFGTDPNHLFIMADIGGGQMQFVDITQKA